VCGHTHMPFARLAHGRPVVDPGSVGMPYGQVGARWALLGPGVSQRRSMFDVDVTYALITAGSGFPGAAGSSASWCRTRSLRVAMVSSSAGVNR
jgi:hypothetical protein